MKRLIAYLGVLACIILGGILGLFASFFVLAILYRRIHNAHLLVGIVLGALIGGALAVIRVRLYLRGLREKDFAKYLTSVPENAGNLIKTIIGQMRYREEARADVMAELIAHFEDALKECATDKEKERKAIELIEQFGDAKLLAVLMRRAKKRCRPLWRTAVARTFQTIGILILFFIVYTLWFISGKPAISIDYLAMLNQMSRPQLRDEDNAWPHYEKAINLYIEPIKDGVVEEFISFRDQPGQLEKVLRFTNLNEDEQSQILEWIQHNQKHWDNLSAEQQRVILKCFQYNWVPIFKKPHLIYSGTPFKSMTRNIIEAIKEKKQIVEPYHTVAVRPEHAGFPDAELTDWMKRDKVPPNYIKAVSVAVLNEWMKRYKELPVNVRGPLTDTEYEYIGPWIRENEAAWQEFVAGSSKSYCYREYGCDPNSKDKWLFNIVLPHLNALRSLARLGIWQARIDIHKGQVLQALEDCLAVARAGSHWQGKGTLIEQLVVIAISALSHEEILHIIATQNLSAIDLKQIQQQLLQIYPQGYPLFNIEGERIGFLDTVQYVFTDGGPGGGHLIPGRWDRLIDDISYITDRERKIFMHLYTAASMVHARRDETISKFNEVFDKLTADAKMSPYERHIRNVASDDIILTLPKYRYFLIHIFMPASSRISELGYRSKTLHEATVTILALKLWRLEKGEYPANLDELIAAGFLKELPTDPYSNKPLNYKKTDDNFILYSVSPNFTDDGGEPDRDEKGRVKKWSDNGDMVFWPVLKADGRPESRLWRSTCTCVKKN
jgi:hypothetical protein